MLTLVLASDDNYSCHLAATLVSVAQHAGNQGRRPKFFILDAGISANNRARLEALAATVDVQLAIIESSTPLPNNIALKRYGAAALLRIRVAELLPGSIERAVYLDCDTLAMDDIAALADLDLGGHPVAAVENLGGQAAGRLGIAERNYFNSGMLVLDLEQWRRRGLGDKIFAFMQDNADKLVFPDQDGLNAVLHQEWKRLPLRWNQQPATYSMYAKLQDQTRKKEFLEAIVNPAIVHFLGRNKPWDYMTFHPLKDFYWHYLDRTPWQGMSCQNRTFINMIKKALMLDKQLRKWQRQQQGPSLAGIRSGC